MHLNKRKMEKRDKKQLSPCYKCKWGAVPGEMMRCNASSLPDIWDSVERTPERVKAVEVALQHNLSQIDIVAYVLPTFATAEGCCKYYTPIRAEK